ncbi:MAG: hypothetical protein ABII00_09015, partial [Elusimicrobiota bacterium]
TQLQAELDQIHEAQARSVKLDYVKTASAVNTWTDYTEKTAFITPQGTYYVVFGVNNAEHNKVVRIRANVYITFGNDIVAQGDLAIDMTLLESTQSLYFGKIFDMNGYRTGQYKATLVVTDLLSNSMAISTTMFTVGY